MREGGPLAVALVTALIGRHLEAFSELLDEAVRVDAAGVIGATATLAAAMAEAISECAGEEASVVLERFALNWEAVVDASS